MAVQTTAPTPRIAEVSRHVPALLEVYFDVLIAHANESHMRELVPLLLDRVDQVICSHLFADVPVYVVIELPQVFPLPSFQEQVAAVVVSKLLDIFAKYPSFVVIFKVFRASSSSSSFCMRLLSFWLLHPYSSTGRARGRD
jgi:hypothetical protein